MKGMEAKGPFFVVRPFSQDRKDTNKFLIRLACEILFE